MWLGVRLLGPLWGGFTDTGLSSTDTHLPTQRHPTPQPTTTTGLPEFEFHRFALSDVYNFFF